jgi:prevent-host-death family protein
MTKTISATELKASIGEHVNAVRFRGDTFLVTQRGKEVAALVPIHVLKSFEASRRRMVEIMEQMGKGNNLTEDEAMRIALEEVHAARREKRERANAEALSASE